MTQTNDWISLSVFSARNEWPIFLNALDKFLNSTSLKDLAVKRIIEFNHLYGSNIRLYLLPATGKQLPLATALKTFFQKNFGEIQIIPEMHATLPAVETALAIRGLLSEAIIAAFRIKTIDDDSLFTMAFYLHLTLLKQYKTTVVHLSNVSEALFMDLPYIATADLEKEYANNKELLYEMNNNIFNSNYIDCQEWLPEWANGYRKIIEAVPASDLPAIYRCTIYLIMKQLGLSLPMIVRLEYFLKKIAEAEIIHS